MCSKPDSLPLVYKNFQEIYGAVTRTDTEKILLSCVGGESLAKSDSSTRIPLFLLNTKSISKPLHFTAAQFDLIQESWLEPQLKEYRRYLCALTVASYANLDRFQTARNNILEWYTQTSPLLTLMESGKTPPKLQQILNEYFPDKQPFQSKYTAEVKRYFAIIRIDLLYGDPLPLNDWLLMSQYKEEGGSKTRHLAWVARLVNNHIQQINPFHFLKALGAVAEFFKSINDEYDLDACSIAYTLWANGYQTYLIQPDQEQLKWRENLTKGDRLGDYQIVEKDPEIPRKDNKLIYYLDSPAHIAKTFPNRFVPFLYKYSSERFPPPIPLVETTYVDAEGRFIIQERLDEPTAKLRCDNLTIVGEEEKKVLAAPIQIMQYFLDNNWVPERPLDCFRLRASGEMRALKPFVKTAFWLDPFERYALTVSRGNNLVYAHLMSAVNIQKSKLYGWYKTTVEKFAEGVESYPSESVVQDQVKMHYSKWKSNMEILYKTIKDIRENAKQQFYAMHRIQLDEKKLKNCILSFYQESYAITILPANTQEVIFRRLNLKQ